MFESMAGDDPPPDAAPPAASVTAETLQSWITGLTRLDRQVDDLGEGDATKPLLFHQGRYRTAD